MIHLTEERKLLIKTVSEFAKRELAPKAEEIDINETWNDSAFKKLGELGLLGVMASPDYGGAGLSCTDATLVLEELSYQCASTALTYLAHAILCVQNINENASSQQKKHYLPKLISGEWIGGMALTEPSSGSDALGISTRAEKKNDRFLLNGTKMFITNGPIGDIFVVYARTGKTKKDISTFIVEKTFKGFNVGKKLTKFGMRGSPTSELIFENCEVPEENLIGKENDSITHMMRNLNVERITISGISLGIARACLNYCCAYAKERKQFGIPIAQFQLIQEKIAEMATNLDAATNLVYAMAYKFEQGQKLLSLGAKAKLFAAKTATQAGLEAIQILGGYGYMKEYPVERYMRDAKLIEIGAGTNEIMKNLIAKELLVIKQ